MGDFEDGKLHLLAQTSTPTSTPTHRENQIVRTGNAWTATAHIITAVLGSGILSLPWSVAQLGWIAGPPSIIGFALITYFQATLLADCYRSPDPDDGHIRNQTYMEAVKINLGEKNGWFCGLVRQLGLIGVAIAYTITSAKSMSAIQESNCYAREGKDANCSSDISIYALIFGAVQLGCSLIPDFHNMVWLSVLATITSFAYSTIGSSFGLSKAIENGEIKGSIVGVPAATTYQKTLRISQALGDIAFSYPFLTVLLEIQDTLKAPPAENKTMKKASALSVVTITSFYMCCGCFGYAAFGDDTPGYLLSGFASSGSDWIIDFANVCIFIHLVGGYQVHIQPVFAIVEKWFTQKFPNSEFVNNVYSISIPFMEPYRLNLFTLSFRSIFVAMTTTIALMFPYFNSVLGILGSINFTFLVLYFPLQMSIVQRKIATWSKKWILLQTFGLCLLGLGVFTLLGSIIGLIDDKLS